MKSPLVLLVLAYCCFGTAGEIHREAEKGEVAELKRLLAQDPALLNARDATFGRTPLHWAAFRHQRPAVELLVASGAEVNAKDNYGQTPLDTVVSGMRAKDIVELLRGHGGKSTSLPDFHVSVLCCDLADVKQLLADNPELATVTGRFDMTALHWLAALGNTPNLEDIPATAKERMAAEQRLTLAQLEQRWQTESVRHEEMMKLLVANGADVNAPDRIGMSPLHRAVSNLAATKFLIANGADVAATDLVGATPLHLAASGVSGRPKKEVLQLLLASGADANVMAPTGTPLHMAASGSWDVAYPAELLLAHGADVNARNKQGRTPLHVAVPKKTLAAVLLAKGADVNAKDSTGMTPLHCCTDRRRHPWNKPFAELLLSNNADVEVKDNHGKTPLHLAAERGNAAVVDVLITHGASVNVKDDQGHTPLDWAFADKEAVRILRQHGGKTAVMPSVIIHDAVRKGDLERVRQLVTENPQWLDARDRDGRTPLLLAVSRKRKEIAAFLISRKAKVNVEDNWSRSPLGAAVTHGQTGLAQLLIDAGANVNLPDARGWTPLHKAVWSVNEQSAAMAELLVSKGAKANPETKDGKTPLDLATERGNEAAAAVLRRSGGDPGERE